MISVAISSFNRHRPLYWGLKSIADHMPKLEFELVVVNDGRSDDGTEAVCGEFLRRLPLKYVFSGQRHTRDLLIPRNPASTNNLAVRSCLGDKIILSCAEIYHFQDSITASAELLNRRDVISTPAHILLDVRGDFLQSLESGQPEAIRTGLETRPNGPPFEDGRYNFYPFFMGMRRERFDRIGGYDEDFTDGYGHEDTDLVWRLRADGGVMEPTPTVVAHLYHGPRNTDINAEALPGFRRNKALLNGRRGQIVRNKR